MKLRPAVSLALFALMSAGVACSSAMPTTVDESGSGGDTTQGSVDAYATKDSGSGTNNGQDAEPSYDGGGTIRFPDAGSATDAKTADASYVDSGSGVCSTKISYTACWDCCDPNRRTQAANDAFGNCACNNPGVCANVCGNNYCQGGPESSACTACLDNASQCIQAADTTCANTSGCQLALQCAYEAQCNSKP